MIQKNKYDAKGLTLGILISLGAGGLGFLLGHYGVPYIVNGDLSCSTLTEDDWKKSPLHDQIKSLESFIQSCNVAQSSLDFQVKVLPGYMLAPVGFGIFFVNWIRLGWHIKDEAK